MLSTLLFVPFGSMQVYAADCIIENELEYGDENLPHLYSDEISERLFTTDYIVTVSKANIRTGPGSKYSSVGYVYKDDIIHVISISNGWAKFKINGNERYIYASYLKKNKNKR